MALTRTDIQARLYQLTDAVGLAVSRLKASVEESDECDAWIFGKSESSCDAMRGSARKLEEMAWELSDRIIDLDGRDIAVDDFHFIEQRAELIISSAAGQMKLQNQKITLRSFAQAVLKDLADFVGEVLYIAGKAAGKATKGLLFGLGPVGLILVAALVFVYAKGKAA